MEKNKKYNYAGVHGFYKRIVALGLVSFVLISASLNAANIEKPKKDFLYTSLESDLKKSFTSPCKESKPWTFWYWMCGNVTPEGITYDLESMAKAGIGGTYLFSIDRPNYEEYVKVKNPANPPSEQFWKMVEHAVKEGDRLGIEIAFNACPGWAVAGGPWITPEFSMQKIVSTSTIVEGGKPLSLNLPKYEEPKKEKKGMWELDKQPDYYKDIAVWAFPASANWKNFDSKSIKGAQLIPNVGTKIGMKLPRFAAAKAYDWADPQKLTQSMCVPTDKMIDLTSKMSPDGKLNWTPPAGGTWIIQRFGAVSTGETNRPTCPEGRGLECDKFNPEAVRLQFENWYGAASKRMGKLAGKTFSVNHSDSWECGAQNWSPVFRQEFIKRRGYDPIKYLPVTEGIPVGSAEESERFLWDWRRTIVDLISDGFFKTSVDLTNSVGSNYSSETVSGIITDSMQHYRETDFPMAEFWIASHGQGAPIIPRAASGAHIYGKRLIQVEAFTERGINWEEDPYFLKPLGDYSFTSGANRFALHVWAHQAFPEKVPGVTLFRVYGTVFSGNQPWHEISKPWFDYVTRCQSMLLQGLPISDVCYFIGEELPNDAIQRQDLKPALPWGYNYDCINRDALLTRTSAKDGRMVLPDGLSYKVLVLPNDKVSKDGTVIKQRMSVEVAKKIGELASKGVLVIGPKPAQTFTLANFPKGDKELADVVAKTWKNVKEEKDLGDLLSKNGTPPDIEFIGVDMSWVHRGKKVLERHADWNGKNDTTKHKPELGMEYTSPPFTACHRKTSKADFYFVSNQELESRDVEVAFRITGKQPELWDPETGEMRPLTNWTVKDGRTIIPLHFTPAESYFIVFKDDAKEPANKIANFPSLNKIQELEGSWIVEFQPNRGAPKEIELPKLESLSNHSDDGVKYFSGVATYKHSFKISPEAMKKSEGEKIILDLGKVKNVAEVTLNGKKLQATWKPPYQVDITSAVKAGENTIEIQVANTWKNRLIGDAKLPEDKKVTWTLFESFPSAKKSKPIPSGLMGPITVLKSSYNKIN